MNIEEWIKEKSVEVEWPKEHFNYDLEVAIRVSDLLELIKTHAIVPREPSHTALASGIQEIELRTSGLFNMMRRVYKAMIEAMEGEDERI